MIKAIKDLREEKETFKLLAKEVEKQGVLVLASRLDSVEEQREFMEKYWELKEENTKRWY